MAELFNARIVTPLWCVESIVSKWVLMEADFGKDRLIPARLQKVVPPDAFETIQAADLVGWDGSVSSPRVLAFVRTICERLGRGVNAPLDLIEELGHLPPLVPLSGSASDVELIAPSVASTAHDDAFWERQWEKVGTGVNLVALQAVAEDAPRFFANQARARISEIEAARSAQAERENAHRLSRRRPH